MTNVLYSITIKETKGEKMTFGQTLRKVRSEKGYSLEALAKLSKISKAAIFNIEQGKALPGALTIAKLAPALGVDYEYLFDLVQKERN